MIRVVFGASLPNPENIPHNWGGMECNYFYRNSSNKTPFTTEVVTVLARNVTYAGKNTQDVLQVSIRKSSSNLHYVLEYTSALTNQTFHMI